MISKNNKIKEINNINYFSFNTVDGMAYNDGISYKIECSDKCIAIIRDKYVDEEDSVKIDITKEEILKLETILNKYAVSKWDGFQKSDNRVLDGRSFGIYIRMENGDSISASGYMKWPKNYREVRSELESFFNDILINKEKL